MLLPLNHSLKVPNSLRRTRLLYSARVRSLARLSQISERISNTVPDCRALLGMSGPDLEQRAQQARAAAEAAGQGHVFEHWGSLVDSEREALLKDLEASGCFRRGCGERGSGT